MHFENVYPSSCIVHYSEMSDFIFVIIVYFCEGRQVKASLCGIQGLEIETPCFSEPGVVQTVLASTFPHCALKMTFTLT